MSVSRRPPSRPGTVVAAATRRSEKLCSASTAPSGSELKWARTPGSSASSTSVRPQASSGASRYRSTSDRTRLRSESGSPAWSRTFTRSGPYAPSVIGLGKSPPGAVENPAPSSAVHCMGVRTACRPSAARFSPIPISSP